MPNLKTTIKKSSTVEASFAPRTVIYRAEVNRNFSDSYDHFVGIGDFNGDGKSDIVATKEKGNPIVILFGDGKGKFAKTTTFGYYELANKYTSETRIISLCVSDVNADNVADIVTVRRAYNVPDIIDVLLGDGLGGFSIDSYTHKSIRSLHIGDFDGDGKSDVLLVTDKTTVGWGQGNGSLDLSSIEYKEIKINLDVIAVGDFNGDGKSDLITSTSCYLSQGRGGFSAPISIGKDNRSYDIKHIADFNGDGKMDLATNFFGNGDGTFKEPTNVFSSSTNVSYGDLNSDGKADVVSGIAGGGWYDPYKDGQTVSISLNILAPNNVPKGNLNIDGVLQQNKTLTIDNKLSDIDGLGVVNFQWVNGDIPIAGATKNTYTLTQNDVGKNIGVKASYVDLKGATENITATTTAKVKNVNDLPVGFVSILGEAKEGKTLTASNTLTDVDGMGKVGYQWQAEGKIIKGATTETYTLAPAEHGKSISVIASYTDGYGTKESLTSTPTDLVTNHAPTGEITILGEAKIGSVLSIVSTLADADGLGDFSYQWLINDYPSMYSTNDKSYTIGELDAGATISVKVSYFDGEGTDEVVVSKPTLAVSAASSVPTFGNDQLVGTAQNDVLSALAGNDTLVGGLGADILTGGRGADIFRYSATEESGITSNTRDIITDFNQSEGDKIDLATGIPLPFFTFIGSNAFNKVDARGHLRFDTTSHTLYGSFSYDGTPEFSIQLNGVKNLVADDLILISNFGW